MLPSRVALPFLYRALDFGLGQAGRLGVKSLTRLDWGSLHTAAIRSAGLSDFGNPYYEEGLNALLESVRQDAGMHAYGRFVYRILLINYLKQRLLFVDALKRKPAAFQTELNPPIIITGLPRSGTTFMHRLLSGVPGYLGIPYWRLFRPFPLRKGPDLRRTLAWVELNLLRPALPRMDVKHVLRSEEPEEDLWLTGLTFYSPVFWILAPVTGYLCWFLESDRTMAYAEHALLLRWFQAAEPDKTLVMKAPDHMPDLDKLLAAVPNARVIRLQRDHETCALSLSSLLYTSHALMTADLEPQRLLAANQALIAHYLDRGDPVHSQSLPLMDVAYSTFVSDPLGVTQSIYEFFRVDWTGDVEGAIRKAINGRPSKRQGNHHYKAADYIGTN